MKKAIAIVNVTSEWISMKQINTYEKHFQICTLHKKKNTFSAVFPQEQDFYLSQMVPEIQSTKFLYEACPQLKN